MRFKDCTKTCSDCESLFINLKSYSNHVRYGCHKSQKYLKEKENNRLLIKQNFKKRISKIQMGKNNSNWKGDKVQHAALHAWVRRHKPKSEWCENCLVAYPYDLANISQEYKRDINDFEWLCRRCHMVKDGRIKNLCQYA